MKITFDFNNSDDLNRLQKIAELLSKGVFDLKEPKKEGVKAPNTMPEVPAPKKKGVKAPNTILKVPAPKKESCVEGETLSLPELRELIISKISNSKDNKENFIHYLKNELKVDHLDKVDVKDYAPLASFVGKLPE